MVRAIDGFCHEVVYGVCTFSDVESDGFRVPPEAEGNVGNGDTRVIEGDASKDAYGMATELVDG